MRLWSIHPTQLDRAALVACWRESLLAQKVLAGGTRGYTHHPQLERFREQSEPLKAVGSYLVGIADEATRRGYHFDRTKILDTLDAPIGAMTVNRGQLEYEWSRLRDKTAQRAPEWHALLDAQTPSAHPLFTVVEGPIASWERI